MYRSTKTYGHNVGLSACFRQWRADSHCNKLHGYALQVGIEFEATHLDNRNWVVDFGALKPVKAALEDLFDHKTLIAFDDPDLSYFQRMDGLGLIDIKVVPGVGCESFAKQVFDMVDQWLKDTNQAPRVRVAKIEVREHGANSGIYQP
ncbi:MAG TPA: 6-carboxytetrahydropterin synthase [Rhizorhapis sp.]|nr:6-carboxytetrahydropterin synthase [Rhizorhapis sp.]